MTTEYEMHPLTQELLYEELGDEKVHKRNIKELLKVISDMLPRDVLDIILYIAKNKTLMLNIEKVIEHADKLGIKNKDSFIIKVSLLRAYTDLYLYNDAERLIKDISENYIEDSYYQSDELLNKYSALFYLVKGKVLQYYNMNEKKAIGYYKKAKDLSQNLNDSKLRYFILMHMSQIYIYIGDIKSSKHYFRKLEQEQNNFLSSFDNKHTYYWMKGKLLFEEWEDEDALKNVGRAEEIEYKLHYKKTPRVIPILLFKADILLRIRHYYQVDQILKLLFEICTEDVGNYNKFMTRILRLNAELQLTKGNLLNAQENIQKAKRHRQGNIAPDIFMGDIYVVKGDILYAKGRYQDAVDVYEEAYLMYMKIFHNKIEVRKLDELFEKLVNAGLKADERYTAKKYYRLHFKHFEKKNPKRTAELLRKISDYDMKRSK